MYGIVPPADHAVSVRDALSGASGAVLDGRYFVLLIPPTRRGLVVGSVHGHAMYQVRYRLQALNGAGRVVARSAERIEP